jgi:tetratricopeptide (TPR) repeat protein
VDASKGLNLQDPSTEPTPIEPDTRLEAEDSSSTPDPSVATWVLPGGSSPPPAFDNVLDSSMSDSVQLPLLDSWGRDIEVPPIPGTVRAISGIKPILNGYEILGELGRGGMGVVYKAKQQGLDRFVAIKMVLGGDHAREEDLFRFKVEAQAVASIQHPNIVQIYEVGEKDGTPYFSLEYIDGGTLHQKIANQPQSPRESAAITHQLALALEHFHQRGVIHRDLKPANILMTLQGIPKITDFGLAKRLEGNSSQTRTGSLMGTPSYMAPEQANGIIPAIGPLSDLYSLGAILYEMLTGRPPFQGATMLDTLDQVRSQEPVPPRRLQPKIPRDLETICLKCLQKDPAKRYPDASELAGDLDRFLKEEPIKARPIGRLELGWRWARRNPWVAALSISLFLLGVSLLGSAFVGAYQIAREVQTINDARISAEDRLGRGKRAIERGDVRQALEYIGVADPFIERTPELSVIRDATHKLQAQIQTFAEFRRRLDLARYYGLLGSKKRLGRAREEFRELIALYDEIESHQGRGEFGLPPLLPEQLEFFKEDAFDMFLVATQVELMLEESSKDPEAKLRAARQSLTWLDRAEKLLPPTRALYVWRQRVKEILGDQSGYLADKKIGESIEPNSPVDLFWRGYADQVRADALNKKDASTADKEKAIEYYRRALDSLARYIQYRPENFWGHYVWAVFHYKVSNFPSDAFYGYTTCIQLRPEYSWPYHGRAEAHAKYAQVNKNTKEYVEVVRDETLAIERDPEYLEAYLGRIAANQQLGNIHEAIADYDVVIKLEPKNYDLKFKRAALQFDSRNYEAALLDLDDLIRTLPKAAVLYRIRAMTRFALHDFDGSFEDWSKYVTYTPNDHEHHYYRGAYAMGLRHYDEAIRELDACLAIKPDDALALLAKARIDHWRGDDASSLQKINDVMARIDSSAWSAAEKASYVNERMDLYRNLGRLDDSEQDARRSIEIDPTKVDAYLGMAILEKKRGKPVAEVQAWYDRMLAANPNSAEVHLRRAEFFRDLGRWDEALAETERARSLDLKRGSALAGLVQAGIDAARGNFDGSTAEASAILQKDGRPTGQTLYAAACVWSLAARSASKAGDEAKAKVFGDRATELLRRSLTEGFHDFMYQDHERMMLDPALEAIADRAEVRRLLSFLP